MVYSSVFTTVKLSDEVEGIDMLDVDFYVRIGDMSLLQEGAPRFGLGKPG